MITFVNYSVMYVCFVVLSVLYMWYDEMLY
jgi:hypothetical protein